MVDNFPSISNGCGWRTKFFKKLLFIYFTHYCLAFTADIVITLVSKSQYKYIWKNTPEQSAYPFSWGSGGAWLSRGTRGTLDGEGRRTSHNCTTRCGKEEQNCKNSS